jgi:hypothetical protein
LAGLGIEVAWGLGRMGFAATDGGLGASECTTCLDTCANFGFGDLISGLRGFAGAGDGVTALTGKGETERGALRDCLVVGVADLLTCGRSRFWGDAAFCSNIPIKDVVGGIGEVSSGWSTLSREELPPLLTDGDLGPRPDGLSV